MSRRGRQYGSALGPARARRLLAQRALSDGVRGGESADSGCECSLLQITRLVEDQYSALAQVASNEAVYGIERVVLVQDPT